MMQPLFGKDSSPHKTSLVLSLFSTLVIWIIMGAGSVFIKISPKNKTYETVQIILDSAPYDQKEPVEEVKAEESEKIADEIPLTEELQETVEEMTETVPDDVMEAVEETVEQMNESVVEEPVIPDPVVEPSVIQETVVEKPVTAVEKAVEEIKTPEPEKTPVVETPVVTEEVKTEPVQQQLVKSAEELWAEQMANKKQKTDIDWDAMFGDDNSAAESSTQSQQKKVTATSETAGSVATTNTDVTSKQTTKSTEKTEVKKVSDTTTGLLSKVAESSYVSKSSDGTESVAAISSDSSEDGKIRMKMADGTKRTLLKPSVPNIVLSDKAAAVTDACTVTISFTVLENGNVPLNDIKITPESILPSIAKNEIIDQINQWLFESGGIASASFQYTIVKK